MEKTKMKITHAICSGECSCIIVDSKQGRVIKEQGRGIGPLLRVLDQGINHCMAGDKIIGKAAAMILVSMKATFVYGKVMSEGAARLFDAKGILYEYGTLASEIRNRKDTGLCPMEEAVLHVKEPEQGILEIRKTLERLRKHAE